MGGNFKHEIILPSFFANCFNISYINFPVFAQESDTIEKFSGYKLKLPEFKDHDGEDFNEYLKTYVTVPPQNVEGKFVAYYKLANVKPPIQLIEIVEKSSSGRWDEAVQEMILFSFKYWQTAYINETPIESIIKIEATPFPSNLRAENAKGNFTFMISPEIAIAYYNEGVKMSEQKNYEEAIKFFDESLYLSSKDIDALYNRGVCKFKIGDNAGACEDWYKIKSLDKPDADNLLSKYCQN